LLFRPFLSPLPWQGASPILSGRRRLSLSETQFGWQVKPNRAMFLSYERSLQPDLVGADIIVPIAGLVGSRDPGPSASD
jgi:hypothetical protein